MFDFDGTITAKGVCEPSREMVGTLIELAGKVPIAFCTGRQLESFLEHGYDSLVSGLSGEKLEQFLKNLFLMGENGAIGYFYNMDRQEFEEFYRADWPEEFIERKKFMNKMSSAIERYGSVYNDAHRVVVVLRTTQHKLAVEDRDIEEVYRLSDKLYEIAMEILTEIDVDFEKHLHVGNAGLGVVISPADGDKDMGIQKFAEFLRKERGFDLNTQARDILVVGDRPQKNGNDHYFLKGEYGTPYTVGDIVEGADYPLPVLNENGEYLKHDEGTRFLLKKFFG